MTPPTADTAATSTPANSGVVTGKWDRYDTSPYDGSHGGGGGGMPYSTDSNHDGGSANMHDSGGHTSHSTNSNGNTNGAGMTPMPFPMPLRTSVLSGNGNNGGGGAGGGAGTGAGSGGIGGIGGMGSMGAPGLGLQLPPPVPNFVPHRLSSVGMSGLGGGGGGSFGYGVKSEDGSVLVRLSPLCLFVFLC